MMGEEEDAVWITGVGLGTPLGFDLASLEANFLAGQSAVTAVTAFPTTDFPSRIAAQVKDIPCPVSQDRTSFDRLSRLEQVTLWCVESSLRDAGCWDSHRERRIGLVMGMGAEWLVLWEADAMQGGTRVREPHRDCESLVLRTRQQVRARMVATDAGGAMQIALVSPDTAQVKEHA